MPRTRSMAKAKDRLTRVKEGLVTLEMPSSGVGRTKGPATKGPVFFNPAMRFCRDVTVALFSQLKERQRRNVLDGLGGTGARGLRLALECPGSYEGIVINDVNPKAFTAIENNIALNRPKEVTATKQNLNSLMHAGMFTYIDIDPYGTPVPFLDGAVQAAGRGVIGITATDTAALCGSSPKACLRRYGARSNRSHFMHEAGLRILIGFVVRLAARYDKAARPLLSHATDHYMRTYISLEKGARKAEGALAMMGHTVLHEDGHFDTLAVQEDTHLPPAPVQGGKGLTYWGPLWTGPLHDKEVLERVEVPASVSDKPKLAHALDLWRGEVAFGPMFHDVDELSRRCRAGPPRMDRLFQAIEAEGFRAVRTHFSPKGLKTDMAFGDLMGILPGL